MKPETKYRRFCSYGFLRLYRINENQTQTQIGSFAGPNAPANADAREHEDAQRRHNSQLESAINAKG